MFAVMHGLKKTDSSVQAAKSNWFFFPSQYLI